jgi:hypothetical protein
MPNPLIHTKITAKLAKKLPPEDVYDWLMTVGFFPENYVLPPCFVVDKYPKFGKVFCKTTPKGKYVPKTSALAEIQFPKSNYADRTFGILDPEIHCDLAYEIAINWKKLLKIFFNSENHVCSYSFPIPLDSNHPGTIGKLRSGRMIYEFIEMAENDIASEAYQYEYLIMADIKNFYPSIYTHSLAWAIHSVAYIRAKSRRHNYLYLGNRIDRLFQRSNDDKTNGLPIGPAISDVVSEILLARVDSAFSKSLGSKQYLAVRFKDDYRILCKSESDGKSIIKALQNALRNYNLDLNEGKTTIHELPNGIFRPWVSRYHAVNPTPKRKYSYKTFKEVYLAVVAIDRDLPGTGVVDRFLSDVVTKDYKPNFTVRKKTIPKIISLLLMLADIRTKSFPKILGIIEAILHSENSPWYTEQIGKHLAGYLDTLAPAERDNRYLIIWILYFLKSNKLNKYIKKKYPFKDVIVKTVQSNQSSIFRSCKDFKLFVGIMKTAKNRSLLEHLDVFSPQ